MAHWVHRLLLATAVLAFEVLAAGEGRVPTMTRLVSIFQGKESEILSALKTDDQKQLDTLVAGNFQMEPVIRGGADFVTYEQWSSISRQQSAGYSDRFGNMSARDLGDSVVVTFEWEAALGKSKRPGTFHVMDIWKSQGGDWRLAFRLISSLADKSGGRLPGQPSPEPAIPKKY